MQGFSFRVVHLVQPCVASLVVFYRERCSGVEREIKAELAEENERFPVVHVQGGSAIRRPLILLAVCAVGLIGYLARDFLIPTAAAIVLALMLTPVANTFERAHLPPTPAAAASVSLLALLVVGLLAVAIPSISSWASQAPYLTYTLERKLEGIRSSLAIVKQVSDRVEQATSATPASAAAPAPEKVVVREKSMLGELVSTTPVVILQIGYAGVLAFMLLASTPA